MNLTRPPWSKRPALLTGVLALILMSCMNATPPEPGTPPVADPPAAGLPDDALTALVHGPVSSPVYDALKDRLTLVSYDGSQKAADHDVLIFDGNHHDPAAHAQDPLVDEALSAGKWVLGFDVDEAHKGDSLGERLGASPEGSSHSYLVRTEADDQGRPTVWIVDAPVQAAPEATAGEGALAGQAAPSLEPRAAGEFAAGITARLNGVVPPSRDLTPQQNANIPDGLIYKTINYSPQIPTVNLGAANKNSGNGSQTAGSTVNYVFNLYLDNANNLDGNFQYVAVETDVLANPTNGTGTFACNGCYSGADSGDNPDEYAWFLTSQKVSVGPADDSASLFTMVGNSPATVNNVTEYSTSLGFSVGFDGTGGQGSFDYSNSVTRDLTDWKLSNESSPTTAAWFYRTANPWDADQSWDYTVNPGWYDDDYPKAPNDISTSQLQLHTQAAWKTTEVIDQTVNFVLAGEQHVLDAWCPTNGGDLGCFEGQNEYEDKISAIFGQIFSVDLGSVVPNQIDAVSFTKNPVNAGDTVQGTVSLASPAASDTAVTLSSNSSNAILPRDMVTIKQGATKATFDILTNTNGLNLGDSTAVGITASSALTGQETAELTLTRLLVTSLTLADTTVSAGQPTTGTVRVDGPVALNTIVPLASDSANVVVPATTLIEQNQTSATFPVQTNATNLAPGEQIDANITAGGQTAQLQVVAIGLASLVIEPTVVQAGQTATGTITLQGTVGANTSIPLSSSSENVKVPNAVEVRVAQGQASARFPIKIRSGSLTEAAVTITAGLPDASITFGEVQTIFTVQPQAVLKTGNFHNCGLKRDGTVTCWGDNSYGQINVPAGLSDVTGIGAGWSHTCAVKRAGTVVCWGSNVLGENTPPAGLSSVSSVAAGISLNGCALKANGTVVCWGDNSYGQTDVPADLSGVTGVSVGDGFVCALKGDGSVVCWGYNAESQLNVPLGTFSQVSAGDFGACAVRNDGTVACWGGDAQEGGSLTPPAGLSGVKQVSVGYYSACAVKGDSTVVCWGKGSLTVPTGLSGVVQVGMGNVHVCALKRDGTVVCWGTNTYGQAAPPPGLNLFK